MYMSIYIYVYIYIYSKPKRPPSPKKKNPPLPTSPGRHMYTQYHERKHHPTHPCPPPRKTCTRSTTNVNTTPPTPAHLPRKTHVHAVPRT